MIIKNQMIYYDMEQKAVVDIEAVMKETNLKESDINFRMNEGRFPSPMFINNVRFWRWDRIQKWKSCEIFLGSCGTVCLWELKARGLVEDEYNEELIPKNEIIEFLGQCGRICQHKVIEN